MALGWLRQWMGLPDDYFGIIYDTASVSSLHAIAAAREMADPEARVEGAQPILTLYTSQESHSSIEKARHRARHRAEKRAQDSRWTPNSGMRPDALVQAIEADLAAGQAAVLRGGDRRHHLHHQRRSGRCHRRRRGKIRPLAAH